MSPARPDEELAPAQLAALETADFHPEGSAFTTIPTAKALEARGLVTRNGPRIEITDAGRAALKRKRVGARFEAGAPARATTIAVQPGASLEINVGRVGEPTTIEPSLVEEEEG